MIFVNPSNHRSNDLWIEPSAQVRAAGVGWWLDPQHGGSKILGVEPEELDRHLWVAEAKTYAPAAACTSALHFPGQAGDLPGRLCLRQDAGLDDYLAAAILLGTGIRTYPYSPEMRSRIAAVAIADNACYEALGPWTPGQTLGDVTKGFPGLSRLCACSALTPELRAELIGTWLETGDVMVRCRLDAQARQELFGSPETALGHGRHLLYDQAGEILVLAAIDEHAREELAAGREAMDLAIELCDGRPLVAVVRSTITGLSAGRGALSYGYEHAPVVVACSPILEPCECGGSGVDRSRIDPIDVPCLGGCGGTGAGRPTGKLLYTIARATNAVGQVALDWAEIRDELCAREPGWGGNHASCILGSPKPQGSGLDIHEVVWSVLCHTRWVMP